ncbi:MAG: ArsR/SmtB family transcription factor [Candidatus Limnocylindrales bacterium]
MPTATDLADATLLRALADPTRLAIVRQLAFEGQTCQCDLTACCELSQPTVSHHMQVLRAAGLVAAERRGSWVYYGLEPSALVRLRALVSGLLPIGAEAGPLGGRRLPVLQPALDEP